MDQAEWLAEQFEANRPQLRAVAYRMLGSLSAADSAVQESWLRITHSATNRIDNIAGWLTTVVARVSLDMLGARKSRGEKPPRLLVSDPDSGVELCGDLAEMRLANSVGLALLIVLDTLEPAERLAFVLHDLFAVPFGEIAGILERSPSAARELTIRARRRVHGVTEVHRPDRSQQRELVATFLAASQRRDLDALLTVLDPEVILQADNAAVTPSAPREIRGALPVARRAAQAGTRAADMALVNGEAALVVAPWGRLLMVLRFTIAGEKITRIEAIADPERLADFDISVLDA